MKLPNRQGFILEFVMTAMVLFDHPPETAEVTTWSDEDIKAAMDWAHAEYLFRQIDSAMYRPTKPKCLAPYQ